MKHGIHPTTRTVAFRDKSSNEIFLIESTIATEETIKHEGTEYPLVDLDVSSQSHPFYTGEKRMMDTTGRADRFRARMEAAASMAKPSPKKSEEKKVEKEEQAAEVEEVKETKEEVKKEEVTEKTEQAAEETPVEAEA